MPFEIIRNDITKVSADAIVNTANPKPVVGAGTDSAVYRAAGEVQLLKARRAIGEILPGQAAVTEAFGLDADYIIHTVGPVWRGGSAGEKELLRSCYERSLQFALELECESIAFPLISAGSYGFPKDTALDIALSAIGKFLLTHEMEVILVVFDRDSFQLSAQLSGDIRQFIDDHAADELREREYGGGYNTGASISMDTGRYRAMQNRPQPEPLFPSLSDGDLTAAVSSVGQSFRDRLFELIDQSGMDDVTVYKKANIDRKVFSSIKCKKDYQPKKKTAIAFAVALELELPVMVDLLARAGIALSPGSTFDLIIAYFVTHHHYDMFDINAALFEYDQPLLGE